MSFILDALRKSEHERQRQTGPGIADIRAATVPSTRLPVWAIALGGLLAVNLIVVIVFALRNGTAPEKLVRPEIAITAPVAPQPAPLEAASPARIASNDAPPTASVPIPASRQQPALGEVPSAVREQDEPTLRAASGAPAAAQNDDSDESFLSLPTLNDVSLQGAALPELHLDLHVYASRPADRFVFLNMHKYREGGTTPDGTTIERITPDGVVLNHHGVRFLLPRQ